MPGFYNHRSFCTKCLKPYNCSFANHICNYDDVCTFCKQKYCCTNTNFNYHQSQFKCNYCSKICKNEKCLIIHQNKVCHIQKQCKNCLKYKTYNHVCRGQRWCTYCKCAVDEITHQCFIFKESINNKKTDETAGYIFFDYETQIDSNGKHKPNLIVAQRVCILCSNETDAAAAAIPNAAFITCQCVQRVFYNNDQFCEWLFQHVNFIAIAHNLGRFDGYFLLDYLINSKTPVDSFPSPLLKGSQLLCLNYNKLKIIDSYQFIPLALSKFPSTFGFTDFQSKGFFPYSFNTFENRDYSGRIPPIEFYESEKMMTSVRDDFIKWYESQKNSHFDLNQELLKYCCNDVELLKKGCLIFRKDLINISSGLCPFIYSITLPSYCHLLYRQLFMRENSIALIPELGYQFKQTNSTQAILWLKWVALTENIAHIQHCKNSYEKKINQYKLDGWDEEKKNGV